MADPYRPSVQDVVELHDAFLEQMGYPHAALVHADLLESALNRASHAAYYENADLIHQATLMAVGISQSQAFVDGNKRAAYVTARTFLFLNGQNFFGKPLELAIWLTMVAEKERGPHRDQAIIMLEEWLRLNVSPAATEIDPMT